MWIMARSIVGNPMIINTENVAIARDNMNEATVIVLRDGSEYVIDMRFDEFSMKIHNSEPRGLT